MICKAETKLAKGEEEPLSENSVVTTPTDDVGVPEVADQDEADRILTAAIAIVFSATSANAIVGTMSAHNNSARRCRVSFVSLI